MSVQNQVYLRKEKEKERKWREGGRKGVRRREGEGEMEGEREQEETEKERGKCTTILSVWKSESLSNNLYRLWYSLDETDLIVMSGDSAWGKKIEKIKASLLINPSPFVFLI